VLPDGPANILDVTTRLEMFAVYETLMFDVTTLVVCRAFDAKMFPWTWRLAAGAAPVRMLMPVFVIRIRSTPLV